MSTTVNCYISQPRLLFLDPLQLNCQQKACGHNYFSTQTIKRDDNYKREMVFCQCVGLWAHIKFDNTGLCFSLQWCESVAITTCTSRDEWMYQGQMFTGSLLLPQPSTPPAPHWLTEKTHFYSEMTTLKRIYPVLQFGFYFLYIIFFWPLFPSIMITLIDITICDCWDLGRWFISKTKSRSDRLETNQQFNHIIWTILSERTVSAPNMSVIIPHFTGKLWAQTTTAEWVKAEQKSVCKLWWCLNLQWQIFFGHLGAAEQVLNISQPYKFI